LLSFLFLFFSFDAITGKNRTKDDFDKGKRILTFKNRSLSLSLGELARLKANDLSFLSREPQKN